MRRIRRIPGASWDLSRDLLLATLPVWRSECRELAEGRQARFSPVFAIAVQAAAAGEDGGFFWLLWQIIRKYPRVGIGLVLIVLGGVFLGVDFGPLIAGKKTA